MNNVSLQTIVEQAHAAGASDVHISPNYPPVIRVAGTLQKMINFPRISEAEIAQLISSCQHLLPSSHSEENFLDRQHDLSMDCLQLPVRLRMTVYPTSLGNTLALRLLGKTPPKPDDILMPEFLKRLTPKMNGLVLVTGPTGSGKSTTLASWIDFCNHQFPSHIITIEDPIEYVFAHDKGLINQCEVGTHFESYENALRDILRRDPDVLMLGELRDLESIELALHAAETGHLVLGTLHSATAVDAISRIIDAFPAQSRDFARHMLASVLLGVVAQKLVPSDHPSAKQGRVANYEVLTSTSATKNLISEQKEVQLHAVIQTGAVHQMFTFEQHRKDLMDKGWLNS